MTILVTGGAGFIGTNFVYLPAYSSTRRITLSAWIVLTYAGNLETLAEAMKNPAFPLCEGRILRIAEAVDGLFEEEKPDIVVNFAAESHVDRSIVDPEHFPAAPIFMGTQVLMDACRKYGVKRYHQVSTDEVYGDLPLDRPDLFFTRGHAAFIPPAPILPPRRRADLLVLGLSSAPIHLPITISRCSNNYGPYHFPEKLIPLMITRALARRELCRSTARARMSATGCMWKTTALPLI